MIVSIVTPVLNGGAVFAQCIESVIREREACRAHGLDIEIEHLVADGGSTDGSIALAQSYGLVVLQEQGTDLHDRLNRSYLNARGGLIGLLGADDILLPGGIEAIVAAYHRSGRRWVVGGLLWIDPEGCSLGTLKAPPHWIKAEVYACLGWNLGGAMATYFTPAFFKELGGFDTRFQVAADCDLFTRALAREPFARVDIPVAGSRRSGKNYSVVKKERRIEEGRLIAETLGPKSRAKRIVTRLLLKAWVHAAHPAWLAHKLHDRARFRLGLKRVSFFD